MKLHQLKYLCEVIDSGLSVSRASARLHTSPSGISKQLKILEDELGAPLLKRRKTRITGITREGEAAMPMIRRILQDVEQVRRMSREASGQTSGVLSIATTHTNACYALASTMEAYAARCPGVAVHFRQGTPAQIASWVTSGTVDLGIGTAPAASHATLQLVPCYELAHSVVVPRNHPLLELRRLSLQSIARYPLISNSDTSRLARLVEDTFVAKGVQCDFAIRAMDTTAMKKFVERGLGVAILPAIAVDPDHDRLLRAIPAGYLFRPAKVCVITLKDHRLPQYAREFIAIARKHGKARGRQRTAA